MTATTVQTAEQGWHGSRIAQMLTATKRLPTDLQRLFEVLYVKGLPEDRACEELHITPEALSASKVSMFRCLKAAAS